MLWLLWIVARQLRWTYAGDDDGSGEQMGILENVPFFAQLDELGRWAASRPAA